MHITRVSLRFTSEHPKGTLQIKGNPLNHFHVTEQKNRPKEVWFYFCRSPAPSKQSLLHKANVSRTVLASPSFWKGHAQICTSQKTTGQTQNTQRTKLPKAISGYPHKLPQEDKETPVCTTYYFKAKSSWKQILLKNYAFKYFPPPTSFSTPHSRSKTIIKEI